MPSFPSCTITASVAKNFGAAKRLRQHALARKVVCAKPVAGIYFTSCLNPGESSRSGNLALLADLPTRLPDVAAERYPTGQRSAGNEIPRVLAKERCARSRFRNLRDRLAGTRPCCSLVA